MGMTANDMREAFRRGETVVQNSRTTGTMEIALLDGLSKTGLCTVTAWSRSPGGDLFRTGVPMHPAVRAPLEPVQATHGWRSMREARKDGKAPAILMAMRNPHPNAVPSMFYPLVMMWRQSQPGADMAWNSYPLGRVVLASEEPEWMWTDLPERITLAPDPEPEPEPFRRSPSRRMLL